jgi:hypothetical protein
MINTKEQLINRLINAERYQSYLEIGTQKGLCYNEINCTDKTGIDPKPIETVDNLYLMDSDTFFKENSHLRFDIIFIDGLHHSDQVLADVVNSAAMLSAGGTILCHDMMPANELTQRVPRESVEWYGDTWKVGYLLLQANYDLSLKFYNFDCGILQIKLGRESLDDLLCSFSDNLEKLKDINYDDHFKEYSDAIQRLDA